MPAVVVQFEVAGRGQQPSHRRAPAQRQRVEQPHLHTGMGGPDRAAGRRSLRPINRSPANAPAHHGQQRHAVRAATRGRPGLRWLARAARRQCGAGAQQGGQQRAEQGAQHGGQGATVGSRIQGLLACVGRLFAGGQQVGLLNLETAVGRARVGRHGVRWQGQAQACSALRLGWTTRAHCPLGGATRPACARAAQSGV